MRSPSRFIASAPAVGGVRAHASAAQADTQFEPDPCVVTLGPAYTADSNPWLDVTLPENVIMCPVPFNPLDTAIALNIPFQTAEGAGGPVLGRQTTTVFNQSANALQSVTVLKLVGYSATDSTYSTVPPSTSLAPSTSPSVGSMIASWWHGCSR